MPELFCIYYIIHQGSETCKWQILSLHVRNANSLHLKHFKLYTAIKVCNGTQLYWSSVNHNTSKKLKFDTNLTEFLTDWLDMDNTEFQNFKQSTVELETAIGALIESKCNRNYLRKQRNN